MIYKELITLKGKEDYLLLLKDLLDKAKEIEILEGLGKIDLSNLIYYKNRISIKN